MNIWDGHLRLATSTYSQWECIDNTCHWAPDKQNHVTVLKLPTNINAVEMEHVGSLSNPEKIRERIAAIQFMEDRAFISTTSTTDPFYIIDMSYHHELSVVGVLNISGLSTSLYRHDNGSKIIVAVGHNVVG